jgi:hypothetical protein
MNIVAIDPSLISTAVVVNGDIINYCRESSVYNKTGMSKWFKSAEQFAEFKFINYKQFDNYSEGEITKLNDYDVITDMIISDILSKIDSGKETRLGIEGFSFGSAQGDLIDLVTFSTLLRKKILDNVTKDIIILSPSTLKLESCKLTYQPIIKEIGRKVKRIEYEWRNTLGIPGGKFTKIDMARSIIENNNINDKWSDYLKSIKDDILSLKNIPKPHEDINDSWLLYNIIKYESNI